jgi:hypothetical protein
LAPTDLFLEFAFETYRGDRYPGGGNGDWDLGSLQTASLRLGGDLGLNSSWQMGLSGLWANPDSRGAGGHGHDHGDHEEEGDTDLVFSGDSRLALLDLVWKWAPGGDFSRRYLQLQGEYFYRDENGDYLFEDTGDQAFGYRGDQQGLYLQGVYQFRPRWRLGLRYDRLWADNRLLPAPGSLELAEDSGLLSGHDPYRWSAMLDYGHSEFSRLRLQYEYDKRVPKRNQVWMLQYIMSLGAHGAHRY